MQKLFGEDTLVVNNYDWFKDYNYIDFLRDVGKYINVHLKNPINGLITYEGDFVEFDNDHIVIAHKVKTRTVKVAILKEEIDKARLAIKF